VGRLVAGDVRRLDDKALAREHGAPPVIRIRPSADVPALVHGAFDPGGAGWLLPYAALGLGLVAIVSASTARTSSRIRPTGVEAPSSTS
jgi:hypothetical protein